MLMVNLTIYGERLKPSGEKIKSRKVAGLDEISPKIWKTRKIDDILPRLCSREMDESSSIPFLLKGNLGITTEA